MPSDAEDGLVVLAMDVRERKASVGRDGQLEEIEGAVGLVAGLDEGDAHFAYTDGSVQESLSLCEQMINPLGFVRFNTPTSKDQFAGNPGFRWGARLFALGFERRTQNRPLL